MNLISRAKTWITSKVDPAGDDPQKKWLYASIDGSVGVEDIRFWKQHIPEYSQKSRIGFTSPKFQDYVLESSSGPIHARSMLTQAELSLLYALARHYYKGVGHIVDLGPLIGIGTFSFAQGLVQNCERRESSRIFSYDLFLMENMSHFLPSEDAGGTGSVFHRFLEINRDFLDFLIPVPGDITKMQWNGEPIEILFVDLAKTWNLNSYVISQFFRHLIPGHSILIQQDYVHVGEPWIALTMEVFSEYFEHLYFIYGATSVYRLIRPIPSEILEMRLREMSLSEMDRHMENARRKATPAIAEVLKTCQAVLRIEKGDLKGAAELIENVDVRVKDGNDETQEFNPAIRANLAAASRWLDQARANPKFRYG